MDITRWTVLAFCMGSLVLLLLAGCVKIGYYNASGEMDAEIVIKPSEEAIENSIESREIQQGVTAEIKIPISKN